MMLAFLALPLPPGRVRASLSAFCMGYLCVCCHIWHPAWQHLITVGGQVYAP
jgi:hypothetical protein